MLKNIEIIISGNKVITKGLKQHEIEFELADIVLAKESSNLVSFLVDYLTLNSPQIADNDTIAYGTWLLQFKSLLNGNYKIEEYDFKTNNFNSQLLNSLKLAENQRNLCQEYGSDFNPPPPHVLIAVSEGWDDDNQRLEGVRYSAPTHMSGWYLTTNLYNGDVKTLQVMDAIHIAHTRPDIADMIALNQGFRFIKDSQSRDIWFDTDIEKSG